MEADKVLNAALKALGHPVARLYYKGKAVSTYFTYQLIMATPTAFADDDNTATESLWRVDLYSKGNYTTLLKDAIQSIKAAGFYGVSIEAEIYEQETGFYHVPIEAKFLMEE